MARLIFVTGGARSGKSRFAQAQAEGHAGPLLYIATAAAGDAEMQERIRRHQSDRGERWMTLEEPLDLAGQVPPHLDRHGAALLDCVTLWVTNLFFAHQEERIAVLGEIDRFLHALPAGETPLYLVSNEVGNGIVPENRLARAFRDLAGEVNQKLAAASDEAWLIVAGLPLRLK